MMKQILAIPLVLLVGAGACLGADELSIGEAAPKLAVKEFVKGEPVKALKKGKIYVVEFWATWCGPCRTSIPHLTELQKKHKDVVFIGVSVWEREPEGVKPFVKEMGDKMDYRVAMDQVEDKDKPQDGQMAKNWMTAAGQNGIPTAFIINDEGKVAWIGHPMEMEKPLEKITAGKWDLATAAREHKEQIAARRKLQDLQKKLAKAQQDGDAKETLAILDQAIADDAKLERRIGPMKLQALVALESEPQKTAEYAKHLMDTVFADHAQGLNAIAWTLVDPDAKAKPDTRLVKIALQAAKQADKLADSKDPGIADTLARACFLSGDLKKAIENQERAVKLAEGTPQGRDPGLKKRLKEYQDADRKE